MKCSSKPSPWPWVIAGAPVLAVAAWGFLRWQGQQGVPSLESFIEQGKPALTQVQNHPPTSGTHRYGWSEPGFHTRGEPREKLVHALEHGNVEIHCDQPGEEALKTLRAWAGRYQIQWDGLVAVPKTGLDQTVGLTCCSWDAAAASPCCWKPAPRPASTRARIA